MSQTNKFKIFNDPIYGFINIPNPLIYDLIQHPYFQRLRRITQMGMSYLVYPGAHHTRFHHALGCLHIMQKAVQTLKFKGVAISEEEENALYITILLHDIGHGPFSHALEHSVIELHHEELSLAFMEQLNIEFDSKLSIAIQIFKGDYPRQFMLQLVSSQLDMDRMDYLKRDSFYTGVNEGNINSERLIQMLNVKDDVLVMEEKGIYSIEKFLMARRLMYWQAYLHKTSIVAEVTLTNILKRAKELITLGIKVEASPFLEYFLNNKFSKSDLDIDILNKFSYLDDYDVLSAIKLWQFHEDKVLSKLCEMVINRVLLKVELTDYKIKKDRVLELKNTFKNKLGFNDNEIEYFVFKGKIKNEAYSKSSEPIHILKKDGSVENVVEASDQMHLKALSKPVTKYYLCYPKV